MVFTASIANNGRWSRVMLGDKVILDFIVGYKMASDLAYRMTLSQRVSA